MLVILTANSVAAKNDEVFINKAGRSNDLVAREENSYLRY